MYFKYNPYSFVHSAANISSVTEFSLKYNDTELVVTNLAEPFDIFIPNDVTTPVPNVIGGLRHGLVGHVTFHVTSAGSGRTLVVAMGDAPNCTLLLGYGAPPTRLNGTMISRYTKE